MNQKLTFCTVILAGGRGTRMSGLDKGLIEWQGKPLIEHILSQLECGSSDIMINANRNIPNYRNYGHTIISDTLDDYQGPLAGILSAMLQCKHDYLLCLPCDSPSPPQKLAQRLMQCIDNEHKNTAICHDGTRLQPLFAMIHCDEQQRLIEFLSSGKRRVHDFFQQLDPAICDFSDQPDHFYNFNTADDMK
ncbi:MAG: molybdenum cofactor guanylyltransferase MobA [Gammaproteobacteria bacterium]